MRFAFILFAAYLFVAWNDAHAGSNECLQGVRAATEAYRMVVYDAANPPRDALLKALDFRISQQPFPVDRQHARMAVAIIAVQLRDSGVRAWSGWQVDWIAEEYIRRECRQ